MRKCLNCGEPVPNNRADSATYCSDICGNRFRNRRWAASNPDKVSSNRLRQNAKTARRILSRTKSRATKDGIPFDLRLDDIEVPTHCPILGCILEDRIGKGRGGNGTNPSIDRIDPSRGYVRGNIGIVSRRANLIKNNLTTDEVRKLLAYMESSGA